MIPKDVYLALLHWPVYDRKGRVVTTAITTIDIHDLARIARTYGLGGVFIVTPLESQIELGRRMVDYWLKGPGLAYNPIRSEALKIVEFCRSLDEVLAVLEGRVGERPKTIATSAKRWPDTVAYASMRERMREGGCYVILLGTGWGLSREVIMGADFRLAPIEGRGYNHLSVRAAAAIIVDRLLGRWEDDGEHP